MNRLNFLSRYLAPGVPVEFKVSFLPLPISGRILETDDTFVALRTDNDDITIFSIGDMQSCTVKTAGTPLKDIVARADTGGSSENVTTSGSADDNDTEAPFILTADSNDSTQSANGLFSPAPRPQLKILGKIDLDSLDSRRARSRTERRQRPEQYDRDTYTDDLYNNADNDNDAEWKSAMIPACGVIKSIGPKFGFITTNNGNDAWFAPEQIVSFNHRSNLRVGDSVSFTIGRNQHGTVALSIHRVKTVGQTLGLIRRLKDYARNDRNASNHAFNLCRQLNVAFEDCEPLSKALMQFNIDNDYNTAVNETPTWEPSPIDPELKERAEALLNECNGSTHIAPYTITGAEKKLAARLLPDSYDEYMERMEVLIELAKSQAPGVLYTLFTRMASFANADDHAAIKDHAIDYYTEMGKDKIVDYFVRLTYRPERHSVLYPATEENAAADSASAESNDTLTQNAGTDEAVIDEATSDAAPKAVAGDDGTAADREQEEETAGTGI